MSHRFEPNDGPRRRKPNKARITTLTNISMTGGMNEELHPFVTVAAVDEHGNRMVGQLDVEEVRAHAFAYMTAAEAAESDAMIARFFTDLDVSLDHIARMILDLRKYREEPPEAVEDDA